jgi:hypothetical protein
MFVIDREDELDLGGLLDREQDEHATAELSRPGGLLEETIACD